MSILGFGWVLVVTAATCAFVSSYGHGRAVHRRIKREAMEHCNSSSRFQRLDGQCNNLDNPSWGSAGQPLERLLGPAYGDGEGSPRINGADLTPLPSARNVSVGCHNPTVAMATVTLMVMQWGQFLDHDITTTPVVVYAEDGSELHCNCSSQDPNCFNIPLENDEYFRDRICLEFTRSIQSTLAEGSQRQQENALTAFIDASNVYGSSEEQSLRLRSSQVCRKKGELRFVSASHKGIFLPENDIGDCVADKDAGVYCFLAGDDRVNIQPGLGSLHTIFMRQHNQLAKCLRRLNKHWDSERVFQEARKIIAALVQRITYTEFLPIVLGQTKMTEYNLFEGSYQYNSSLNPDILNSFATAAYRFGHSLIPESYNISHNLRDLKNMFRHTVEVLENLNDLTMSLVWFNAMAGDRHFSYSVTRHLFEHENMTGLDLVALNIQRGRDHGLPPYNEFRRYCGLEPVTSLAALFPGDTIAQSVYSSIEDVDLFTGGMAESAVADGMVGPTFSCILGIQFSRLKHGDRFFYESQAITGFSAVQLTEIKKVRLSSIICANTDITHLPPNVFLPINSQTNKLKNCNTLPRIHLQPWKGPKQK